MPFISICLSSAEEGLEKRCQPEHVAMLLEQEPEVVSFHFGLPDQEIVDTIKSAGIFIQSSATTVAEARMLERRGVDAVIAQGIEAAAIARPLRMSIFACKLGCSRYYPRSLTLSASRSSRPAASPMVVPRQRLSCSAPAPCNSALTSCAAPKPTCTMHIAMPWLRRMTPALLSPT
jgi:hypothetical protein